MPTTHLGITEKEIDALVALARQIWNDQFTPIIGQAWVDCTRDILWSYRWMAATCDEEAPAP